MHIFTTKKLFVDKVVELVSEGSFKNGATPST